jgi:Ca2+-binding RTX toxin-like protein
MGRKGIALGLAGLLLASFLTPLGAQEASTDCLGLTPTITGTNSADLLLGTSGNDVIAGKGADDVIDGRGGFDVICGDDGDDQLLGGPGVDFLVGGLGADTLRGGGGIDFLFDVDPNDEQTLPILFARPRDESRDVFFGNGGADFLASEGGDDLLDGGGGSDYVLALAIYAPVTIDLADGLMMSSYSGIDTLTGIENAIGTFYEDVIVGDDGPNLLGGTFGADRVSGGNGSDIIYSSIDGASLYGGNDQAADTLWVSLLEEARVDLTSSTVRSLRHAEDRPDEAFGFENVIATPYDDVVIGNEQPNELGGAGGSDRILGGSGDDSILGDGPDYVRKFYKDGRRGGRDFIDGGPGEDVADGGPQRDGCVEVEKKRSCEGEDVPPEAECPDSDPLCPLPIPPLSLWSDPLGVLRALAYTSPNIRRADLARIARLLQPLFVTRS